jgi:signal transduction histidine kinase
LSEIEERLVRARQAVYTSPTETVAELTELLAQLRGHPAGEVAANLALALEALSIGRRLLGDYEAGLRDSVESRSFYVALGDEAGVAKAEILAGNLHFCVGAFESALESFEVSLTLRRKLGDRRGEAGALGSIGAVLDEMGRQPEALRCYGESLAISRELGDRMFEARTLNNLGETSLKLGDLATALDHCTRSLAIFRELDERGEQVNVLNNLGRIARADGRLEDAQVAIAQALGEAQELSLRKAETVARFFLAGLLADERSPAYSLNDAVELMERVLQEARDMGAKALEFDICRELSALLERAGQPAAALKHFKAYHEGMHQIAGEAAVRRIRNLEVRLELERAHNETRLEQAKVEALTQLNQELDSQKRQLDMAVRSLLKSDREKNDLLGMVAHDLKNPLATIMNLTTELTVTGSPQLTATVEGIKQLARGAVDLVNHVLGINQIESGLRVLLPVELDLSVWLPELLGDYRSPATKKRLKLVGTFEPAGMKLVADPVVLRQLLDNLISNAMKFTPAGGEIRVSTQLIQSGVCISVRDTGPGFTTQDKLRMFGRFTRLSAQPTDGEPSSGLGLYISKRLAADLGGSLTCESEGGQGSDFQLCLPQSPRITESH